MISLYFLRHGIAEDGGPGLPDRDRKLTEEGRANMRLEAVALAKLDLKLDAIITSPLARAYETAEIVARALGMQKAMQVDDRLACGCSMADLRGLVADNSAATRIMLVGHNPDFTILPSQLAGGAELRMQKGAVARVDIGVVEPAAGELRWLLPPKLLVIAGGSVSDGGSIEP